MSEGNQVVLEGRTQQKTFDYVNEKNKSLKARYSYGIIFLLVNLYAWFIRDYGQKIIPQLHYLKSCGVDGHDCFKSFGVLRISLGCFIFFFVMFLSTSKTRRLNESRNSWHSSWWGLKIPLLILSMVAPLFFPPDIIQLYGELARVGAGVFLILQLVSVIQFISWWNKYWMPDELKKQSCSFGLFMSTFFYMASLCGIVLMYKLYAPEPSTCALNIFFITWTVILLIVMLAVSLHSKVNRGLLSSGIMASYVVFLCWSAVRSEPASAMEKCNSQKQENRNGDWTTVLSFLIAIFAIVMATFSTGIDSQSFQFRKDKVQQDNDIPYGYGFFHMIFSLGAMYFAMLFISWNLNNSARKWSIDVGWASTWVKIVNEWFAATIYVWTLISPVVRGTKIRDGGEPEQLTDDSVVP